MFNQCSTHLHLLGLLMAKYGHFGPKKAVFERFWGPLVTFFGAIKAQTDPPGCVWQCSAMFNQCPTHLGLLGLPMANYGHFGQKGRFRTLLGPPGDISGWSKRLKLTPPDVKYNVQPCSTNVQPIWACWDCLWPNMAISGQKRAIFGHKNGLNHWNLMGTRLNINQSNPRDNMDALVFAKSNIFLTPPLKHIVGRVLALSNRFPCCIFHICNLDICQLTNTNTNGWK